MLNPIGFLGKPVSDYTIPNYNYIAEYVCRLRTHVIAYNRNTRKFYNNIRIKCTLYAAYNFRTLLCFIRYYILSLLTYISQ